MNLTRTSRTILLVVLFPILLSGCLDSDPAPAYDPYAQLAADLETIDEYLLVNGISNVLSDPRGVRIQINTLGTGLTALGTNKVKINYKGFVLGSAEDFETGIATGRELRGYIPGWQIAFSVLPVGSTGSIYVPSPLAYQNQTNGTIPANAILKFDFEFVDIEESSAEIGKFTSDTTAIENYLSSKAITATDAGNGVHYVVTQQGSGPMPSLYDKVKVNLKFKNLTNDATVAFEQNREPSETFDSRVADNINGVSIVLRKLPVGSKATVYIPSGIGFGPYPVVDQNNNQVLPPNTNLIVEVELLSIL
jgi:FKBP-type peptidyl-prolyl cis-trans isomerase